MFFTLAEFSSKFISLLENNFFSVGIGSILYLILYFVIFIFFAYLLPTVNKYGIFVVIADLLCAFIYQNSSTWFTKEHFTQRKITDTKEDSEDQEYNEEDQEEYFYQEQDQEETEELENEDDGNSAADMSDMSKIQEIVNNIEQLEDDNMTNDSDTPINENLISE